MVRIMALDQDTLGLELTQQQLPQRVRSVGGKKTTAGPSGASAKDGKTATDDDELEGF